MHWFQCWIGDVANPRLRKRYRCSIHSGFCDSPHDPHVRKTSCARSCHGKRRCRTNTLLSMIGKMVVPPFCNKTKANWRINKALYKMTNTELLYKQCLQESPAIADKPARRESMPKLLKFDVPTTLSLTILAYLHAFNCCCVRNPRNPEKFTQNSNLWSSRSSKVIDLAANRKPMYDFLLVTNSNIGRICYRFRDILG